MITQLKKWIPHAQEELITLVYINSITTKIGGIKMSLDGLTINNKEWATERKLDEAQLC